MVEPVSARLSAGERACVCPNIYHGKMTEMNAYSEEGQTGHDKMCRGSLVFLKYFFVKHGG